MFQGSVRQFVWCLFWHNLTHKLLWILYFVEIIDILLQSLEICWYDSIRSDDNSLDK